MMMMMLARNRITMVCVTLSLLVTIINAAALHTDHHLQASNDLANDGHLHHPTLPRKLMVNRKVEGYQAKSLVSSNEQNNPSSGDSNKNREEMDVIMHAAAKGTRQEWIEGSERSHEFFTMDYSHVRRRRPIHNKSSTKTIINSP